MQVYHFGHARGQIISNFNLRALYGNRTDGSLNCSGSSSIEASKVVGATGKIKVGSCCNGDGNIGFACSGEATLSDGCFVVSSPSGIKDGVADGRRGQ